MLWIRSYSWNFFFYSSNIFWFIINRDRNNWRYQYCKRSVWLHIVLNINAENGSTSSESESLPTGSVADSKHTTDFAAATAQDTNTNLILIIIPIVAALAVVIIWSLFIILFLMSRRNNRQEDSNKYNFMLGLKGSNINPSEITLVKTLGSFWIPFSWLS